jgi:hypothetical protein
MLCVLRAQQLLADVACVLLATVLVMVLCCSYRCACRPCTSLVQAALPLAACLLCMLCLQM